MLRLSTLIKLLAFASALVLTACSSDGTSGTSSSAPTRDNGSSASANGDGGSISSENMGGPEAGTQEDLEYQAGSDRVFFAYDRFDLSPEARATLRRQADWLSQYSSLTVTIEGHADERGTREYNLALGDRRATSAKNYLVALGISPSRVSVVSYGKERPAVLGSNEDAWAQNRRSVTVID